MADTPGIIADYDNEPVGAVVDPGQAGVHIEPELWGLAPYQIVAFAMLALILIMIWKKVPGLVVGGLDSKIAAIREQLDEAKRLRAEAEALRDEYSAKIAGAEQDAGAMLDSARNEAAMIIERAEADGREMVARRERMAQDKIAAAEREAVEEVRARAANAAAGASRRLIAERHTADADRMLADEMIANI